MNFSVTKNGKELDKSLYTWDENAKTFSTAASNLVLNFSGIVGVTFKTDYSCIFKTGSYCTFKTSYNCTFKTGSNCTFKTGSCCTFKTGSYCNLVILNNIKDFELGKNSVIILRTEEKEYKKIKNKKEAIMYLKSANEVERFQSNCIIQDVDFIIKNYK